MKKAVIFDMYGVLLHRDLLFLREIEDEEMTKILGELRQRGIQLILLSNIFIRSPEYFKKSFDFLKLFDKLYFSSDTGLVKPDPRAYELVLRENNLKPEEVVFFDDGARNVEAAKALGIESYVFEGSAQVREKLGI